jgi:queuine tRNA-ribosyltransferase
LFECTHRAADCAARAGVLTTPHGCIETPVFMPVGTRATVKMLSPADLRTLGAQIILGNTYHLMTRPGAAIVAAHGGLHQFMAWDRPILTDSGGFQVFSLAELRNITDAGVRFQSHIDGDEICLGPREAMQMQQTLGADIAMAFDECPPSTAARAVIEDAVRRTLAWARICLACRDAHRQAGGQQMLFGIVQGGVHDDLRRQCIAELCAQPFDGFAIGGLAVGEAPAEMYRVTALCAEHLPADRPRYLMGVGRPEDIVEAVVRGMDMFDCVMPTRNARNGSAFTADGDLAVKSGKYKDDLRPIEDGCACYACRTFTRAYIRHLLNVGEALGGYLLTVHNLHFYLTLMRDLRAAILAGHLSGFARAFLARRAGSATSTPDA